MCVSVKLILFFLFQCEICDKYILVKIRNAGADPGGGGNKYDFFGVNS